MKCMITRVIASFCVDFDRDLPAVCRRHMRACSECRDFAAFSAGVEAGLTHVSQNSPGLEPNTQARVEDIVIFPRALPVAAMLALLLVLGLIMGSIPKTHQGAVDAQRISLVSIEDLPEVQVGTELVLGFEPEAALTREFAIWTDEAMSLIASIPLIPVGDGI